MCQIGEQKELLSLTEENGVVGYRGFYIRNFKTNRILSGLSYNIEFKPVIGESNVIPTLENLFGLWSYNNYNNYNCNYNNYNYNYSYNCNYYNYNYNNSNCYYISARVLFFGQVVRHELGYRSQFGRILELVKLTPKEGLNKNFNEFLNHFNTVVEESAKLYEAKTINHVDFK